MLTHYEALPTPQRIFNTLLDFKKAYLSQKRSFMHERLPEFPENPSDLPSHIYASAYDGGAPVSGVCTGVNAVAELIPLRTTSKLLKPGRCDTSAASVFSDSRSRLDLPAAPAAKVEPAPARESPLSVLQSTDAEERALFDLYLQQLRDLRARREQGQSPIKVEPSYNQSPINHSEAEASPVQVLAIHRAPSGALTVRQTTCKSELADAENDAAQTNADEGDATVEDESKTSALGKTSELPRLDDLDPYTRAAIQSLTTRQAVKKENAAAKRKVDQLLLKRPAAKTEPAEAAPIKKEAKAARAKKVGSPKKPITVTAATVLRNMPMLPKDGSNPAPVYYKAGVIYTSRRSKRFRAVRARGDMYSESGVPWKCEQPTKTAWATAVKAIDAGKKPKRK